MNFLERYIRRQEQRPAKRSLLQTYLISLVSLCLSVTMLLGTTMAWFTSGVEVQNNEIYVGILNVDLLLEGSSLKENADDVVFGGEDSAVWYPDRVETRTLTVVNEGEIPFTYKLTLTPGTDEEGNTLDKNKDKETISDETELRNFRSLFTVYVCTGEPEGDVGSAELLDPTVWTPIGTVQDIYDGNLPVFSGESEDMTQEKTAVYTIAVWMNPEPTFLAAAAEEDEVEPISVNAFQGYTLNFNVKLVASQLGTPERVSDAAQLAGLLEAGKSVILEPEISGSTLEQNVTLKGTMLDGGDTTLVLPADTGVDCGITTTGGTVKNIILLGEKDSTRAIGSGSSGETVLTQSLYIDNVVIDSVQYAINGSGDGKSKVVVTNSVIYGWVSFSNIGGFDFVGCTLGRGESCLGYMEVYGSTSFIDCKFEDFHLCGRDTLAEGTTLTFTGCTYGGEQVTAENFRSLFLAENDETDFNQLKVCTITVDGVRVDTTGWN